MGSTAKALIDTRELESIDVVDVSRDVLELNRVVWDDPADYPLADPRVRVHIEDGRQFLQTTDAALRSHHRRAAAAEERRAS